MVVDPLTQWLARCQFVRQTEAALEPVLASYQLNLNEFYLLYFLAQAPDQRLAITSFEQSLPLSQSGLLRMIRQMEDKRCGTIERVANPQDKRSTLLHLTAHGQEVLEAAQAQVEATLQTRFKEESNNG